ncbi:hypothetical protein [Streptosporangium saharense]|uniref:hypothetical protein n=1 Tax=Streptosporangium saharense TaxID=1706840 RepID=UPI00332E5E64
MTPEELDRLHAQAVARGIFPAEQLAAAREAALQSVGGSEQELARRVGIGIALAEFEEEIARARGPRLPGSA